MFFSNNTVLFKTKCVSKNMISSKRKQLNKKTKTFVFQKNMFFKNKAAVLFRQRKAVLVCFNSCVVQNKTVVVSKTQLFSNKNKCFLFLFVFQTTFFSNNTSIVQNKTVFSNKTVCLKKENRLFKTKHLFSNNIVFC